MCPAPSDEALVGRLRYVLVHGVKEGLVARCAEWPGLTCLPQSLGPARRLFRWFNWTKRWSNRESEDMAAGEERFAEEWAEPVELEVAPLPCWKGLGEEERQRAVRGLLEQVEAEARARGRTALGHERCRHSTRIPSPSTSSGVRGHCL